MISLCVLRLPPGHAERMVLNLFLGDALTVQVHAVGKRLATEAVVLHTSGRNADHLRISTGCRSEREHIPQFAVGQGVNLVHDHERRVQTLKLRSLSRHDSEHRAGIGNLNCVAEQFGHGGQLGVHLNHALRRAEHDSRLVTGGGDSKRLTALRSEHKFIQG